MTRRRRGEEAETLALAHLQRQGLRLVERNYRCRAGEIDLIMEHGEALVFVEVRMRAGSAFGGAAASVDGRKQRRILTTALHYLQHHPERARQPARFDVVAIEPRGGETGIDWIPDAFQAN